MINYSHHSIDDSEIKAVIDTLQNGSLTLGEKVYQFEHAICDYIGCRYAVAVGNCTEALHLALLTHGISKGDEVITSPFTFVATANAIVMTGAKPVFVDVTKWGNICLNRVLEKINKKTKAIIVVDYAGYPVKYDNVKELTPDVIWIRDAAHSFGAEIDGKKIGSEDTTCFSFHPCKPITTAEGGIITTNYLEIASEIKYMRAHGIFKPDWEQDMMYFGYNYKMTDIQAVIGLEQLKKIDFFQQKREQIAERYYTELAEIDGIEFLPQYRNVGQTKNSWHLFPVLVQERDKVINKLWAENIRCGVHYKPVHLHTWYKDNFNYKKGDFPMAEYLGEHIMSLPIYPDLTESQQSFIIDKLKESLI